MKKTLKIKFTIATILLLSLSLLVFTNKSQAATYSAELYVKTTSITSTDVNLEVYLKNINAGAGLDAIYSRLEYDKTIFGTPVLTAQNDWSKTFNSSTGIFTLLKSSKITQDELLVTIKLPINAGASLESTQVFFKDIAASGGAIADGGTGDIALTQVTKNVVAFNLAKSFNSTTNAATLTASSDVGISSISTSGWTTTDAGKTYKKVFTSNGTEIVTFTLANGVKYTKTISVTEVTEPVLTVTRQYNATNNSVLVTVTSNFTMTNSKLASGWTLSTDKLKYSKTYTENTNYQSTFNLENGTAITKQILVTEIVTPVVTVSQAYDSVNNVVKVTAKSNIKMIANKDGWTLSTDGLTFEKTFTKNGAYTETFTFIGEKTSTKAFTIDDIASKAVLTSNNVYDANTNTVVVTVTSNVKFTAPLTGWTLDSTGYKYVKRFSANGNQSVNFNFEDLTTKSFTFTVSGILTPELLLSTTYNANTNSVLVKVVSNVKMTNSKLASGWLLSSDAFTYTREYDENTNYATTFTFVDNSTKSLNVLVTEVKTPVLAVKKSYDQTANKVTVSVVSNVKMTNSKVSASSGWSLSSDGLTYTKQFVENTNYSTSFTFVDGKTLSANIVVTEIKAPEQPEVVVPVLTSSKSYNQTTNKVLLTVKSNVKMTNSKVTSISGWVLSNDGLTYTKEYDTNTEYSTSFTFVDGTSQSLKIAITEIKAPVVVVPALKQESVYNATKNEVIVKVISNVKMTNSKVSATSGWSLSNDGLTYTKVYTENTNYSTTFKFEDGTSKAFNIVVTGIKAPEPPVVVVPVLKQESVYNATKNIVTVKVISNVKMTNSKVSAGSGWSLSSDGLTYTKEYDANTNYSTTFKFEDGTSKAFNIVVTGIKAPEPPIVVVPVLKQESVYDATKNEVTVKVISNVKMTNSKVSAASGWSLSSDGLTYTKIYTENTNYSTTFKFEDGTSKAFNIVVTGIKAPEPPVVVVPVLKQESVYNATKNIVAVKVISNVKMTNSKVSAASGWSLSSDGLTYTKEYDANTDYTTTFKFEDGTSKSFNVKVTEIKDIVVLVPVLKQESVYNATKNEVTVKVISNVKMTNSKVSAASGWSLSSDGLTYSKEYTANTNYSTTFKFEDGTIQSFNIKVTEIK